MKILFKELHLHWPNKTFLISAVIMLQFVSAGLITLTISADPKNAVLFGYSVQRLLLVISAFGLACFALVAGVIAYQRKITLDRLAQYIRPNRIQVPVVSLAFVLIVWGWLSIFSPSYQFGIWASYFERTKPLSIALGLSALECCYLLISNRNPIDIRQTFQPIKRKYLLPIVLFGLGIIGLSVFIAVTKIGLVQDTAYWNVPGIPLAGLQIFFMIVLIGLGIFVFSRWDQPPSFLRNVKFDQILVGCIFLFALFGWGLTPMLKHYFALEPTFPQGQPYPFSDARVHDLGAISILKGQGIYFHQYTDKPLYMLFLSVLHIFAGYDYSLLSWLQITVLTLIPVTLFYFGKKYHSLAFGLFLSLIIILRQRNAIFLSYKIASVNPKLLVTEMVTLLGIILFTYLVFLWFRSRKSWLALLSGGVIGAVSLVRLNPLLLFPAIACMIFLVFWKSPKIFFKHLSLYTLGFLILIIPWIGTGVNPQGQPWMLIKFFDVINVRYGQTIHQRNIPPISFASQSATPSAAYGTGISSVSFNDTSAPLRQSVPSWSQNLTSKYDPAELFSSVQIFPKYNISKRDSFLILNHFLHNISTSILALPDSLVYENLNILSQREYWQDLNEWNGNLPVTQMGLVFMNLFLVAVGLGYSWKRYRWAGLVPFFVFLSYSLSLGFAKASGGRYIVPIDWIIYFYYALGIVLIIGLITRLINPKGESIRIQPTIHNPQPLSDRKAMRFSMAGLICLASLIPMVNIVIPAISNLKTSKTQTDAVINTIAIDPQKSESLVSGEVLYPYSKRDGTVDFNLLTGRALKRYSILRNESLVKDLTSGDQVVLRIRLESGNQQVESIYLLKTSSPELIWELHP